MPLANSLPLLVLLDPNEHVGDAVMADEKCWNAVHVLLLVDRPERLAVVAHPELLPVTHRFSL